MTEQTLPRRVVIAGGGLAGIAAAVRLAEAGVGVTLIETRKRLGGRATSFDDAQTGRTLDNCQHVVMGCCTSLLDLYHRLGVSDLIEWHRTFYFASPGGKLDVFEADGLPAPLHLTQSLLAMGYLTWGEKLAIARAMHAMMRTTGEQRRAMDQISFGQWLSQHDQPTGAVEKFWAVVIASACNEWPSHCSARYAIQVFQEGFLASENAYLMGLSRVPLVRLYDSARQTIEAAGGQVLLSESAESFRFDGQRITGLRMGDGQERFGEVYLSALPFDRLDKLCNPAMRRADARLRQLDRFSVSPILGVHMWFDGEVTRLPHFSLTAGQLQWVFNKGYDPRVGGWHLHGVISAAHELVKLPAREIIARCVADLRAVMPSSVDAELIHARAIKEKRATFAVRPGADALRPAAAGAIDNLYLAGDWCDTGWPATMEGAARSGYRAAAAILNDASLLINNLPPSEFYQLVSGDWS